MRSGEGFGLDIHCFDERSSILDEFTRALEWVGRTGLGPARARAELASVSSRHVVLPAILDEGNLNARLTVRFLTPTELKVASVPAMRPEFEVLIARTMERIDNLRRFYGEGPLGLNFAEARRVAGRVRIAASDLRHVKAARRSGRTGQTHPLGGLLGEVKYEGPAGSFVPLLRIAEWTGVGRQTTWGKGAIQVVED